MATTKNDNVRVDNDKHTVTFKGTLESAYKQKKTNDKTGEITVKNVMRVTPADASVYDVIDAYKDSGKNFTPEWFKNKNHIMLRSVYDIPVKSVEGDKLTFDEFCERGLIRGASVTVKFSQKDGAIYPMSMVVHVDGEEYDPFEDM